MKGTLEPKSICQRVIATLPAANRPPIPKPDANPNVELEKEVLDKLNAFCAFTGSPRRAVVNQAVRDYLELQEDSQRLAAFHHEREARERQREKHAARDGKGGLKP